jgi:hypothetical protein
VTAQNVSVIKDVNVLICWRACPLWCIPTNRQNETNNFKISYFLYIFYDKKILEVNKKQNKNLKKIKYLIQ